MSKSWSVTIKSCDNYWLKVCLSLGLSLDLIKESAVALDYSYFSLSHKVLEREASIRDKFHASQNFTTLSSQEDVLVLVPSMANGYYIRHSKDPSPSLGVLRIDGDVDAFCSLQGNVFPNGVIRILWAISSPCRVLYHATNATWGEFKFDQRDPSLSVSFTEWDDTIFPKVYNEFSCCCYCNLVVTVAKSLGDGKTLQCNFVELRRTPVKKAVRSKVLKDIPEELLGKEDILKVKKIHVYCADADEGVDGSCFCREHFMFVQVRSVVIQYKIDRWTDGEKAEYKLVFVKILRASHLDGYASVVGTFTLSCDHKLLGLLTTNVYRKITLHTWNLETADYGKRVLDMKSTSVQGLHFFAVGAIYTVVELVCQDAKVVKKIMVLRTLTGEVLVQSQMAVVIHCTCTEGWTNTLVSLEEPKLYKIIVLDRPRSIHHTMGIGEEPELMHRYL